MEDVKDIEEMIEQLQEKIKNNPNSLSIPVWKKTLERLYNLLELRKRGK